MQLGENHHNTQVHLEREGRLNLLSPVWQQLGGIADCPRARLVTASSVSSLVEGVEWDLTYCTGRACYGS